ncbi:MAG: DUF3383 domain-containing protein [Betaproteobacteria bacterium]|nr:DUF3383 domain-containing protein [Betaproteobacteria bacterium]
MTIPVSKVVDVKIFSSPTFPKRKGFGLLNIIGCSNRLPIGDSIRFYSDMDGVAADFSGEDEEYRAAQIFFSQAPRPTELCISRRFSESVPGELLGSVNFEKDLARFQSITDGGFDIRIDGVNHPIEGIDLSGCANLNALASEVEAALPVGTEFFFEGTRFVLRSNTTGKKSTVDFATPPSGTAIDLSAMLGLDAAGLGFKSAGVDAESVTDALSRLQEREPSWYGFAFTKELTTAQIKEAAAWAEARVKVFGFTTRDSNVLDMAAEDDLCSFMKANMYSRTISTWDEDDPYQIVSAFARAFVVNFEGQNTTITLKFKLLPGTTPVNLTESQRQALVKKNCNYYTYFGDSAMLAEGVMASGRFFDEVHGCDWLQNAIETNVFGYMYTRTTKVPQTDKGVASLVQQVEKACQQGVNNGLLAPGQWNGMDLGEVHSGDYLPKGFYVYAQPVAEQNQSDREARKAPPIQVLAKGAGAIHFANIEVTFER